MEGGLPRGYQSDRINHTRVCGQAEPSNDIVGIGNLFLNRESIIAVQQSTNFLWSKLTIPC